MNFASPIANFDAVSPAPEDATAARTARHVRMLQRLAEIGLALAERLLEPAGEAGGDSAAVVDPGLAYSRIARAVRLTLALETRLAEEGQAAASERLEAAAREARTRNQTVEAYADSHRLDAKEAVEGLIEDERARRGDVAVENLLCDLDERLDEIEVETLSDGPVSAIIARICADLGLAPDWSRWAPEDWALEEAETRAAGSPYGRRRRPAGGEAGGVAAVCAPPRGLAAAGATGPPA